MSSNHQKLSKQSDIICFSIIAYLFVARVFSLIHTLLLRDNAAVSPGIQSLVAMAAAASVIVAMGILHLFDPQEKTQDPELYPPQKTMKILVLFLACLFGVLLLNLGSEALLTLFGLRAGSGLMWPTTVFDWLMTILTYVLLPAILGEYFFRGLILQRLKPFGSRFAVVISSLLFALGGRNLSQLLGLFVLGVFLGWLTIQSGSLRSVIRLRLLQSALMLALTLTDWAAPRVGSTLFYIVFLVTGAAALGVFVTFLIRQDLQRMKGKSLNGGTETKLRHFFAGVPAIAMVLAALFLIAENLSRWG
jgi:membrane protease YdiL (CAAX protease family)